MNQGAIDDALANEIEPVAIAAVVPGYLEQFRPRGQFSIYRPQP